MNTRRCDLDHDSDESPLAVALAPQISDYRIVPHDVTYRAVCAGHLEGWWDGADFTAHEYPALPLPE